MSSLPFGTHIEPERTVFDSKSRGSIVRADPTYIGRFVWSNYWRKWDEILGCHIDCRGLSVWVVREVGTNEHRTHSTFIPENCIFDAPRIQGLPL
jgi:hypothetical protein